MATEIDYPKVFNRLSHLAALSHEGKVQAAVDNLIMVALATDPTFAPRSVNEVIDGVDTRLGIRLAHNLVESSLERNLSSRQLLRDPNSRAYSVLSTNREAVLERTRLATELEQSVMAEWFEALRVQVPRIGVEHHEHLWLCLRGFMVRAFARYGAEAVQLLAPSAQFPANQTSPLSGYLTAAIQENCDSMCSNYADAAVIGFFRDVTPARARYVAQLLDGTFTIFAVTVDEATNEYLRSQLPRLTVFLDTNFIFGVLGLHSHPLVDVSRELMELVRTGQIPLSFVYHEQTLRELDRTIAGIARDIEGKNWPVALSRAAVKSGRLRGLELQYHKMNADAPVDPGIFLSKYRNLSELMKDFGFHIYREPNLTPPELAEQLRLVAGFSAYLDRRGRDRADDAIWHDITLWLAVKRLRGIGRTFLNAKSFFLTTDFQFHRFDWQELRNPNEIGVAVLPHQLLQVMRPFVPPSSDFDRRFVEAFAIPDIRTGVDFGPTASRVLDYLRNYAEVSESTATRILANEMLLARLEGIEAQSPEFQEALEFAVAEDNERLRLTNEALQSDRNAALLRERELGDEVMRQRAAAEQALHAATTLRHILEGLLWAVGLAGLAIAAALLRWSWLDDHPHKLGIYICAGLLWSCLVAVASFPRQRGLLVIGGLVSAIGVLAQIVDRPPSS